MPIISGEVRARMDAAARQLGVVGASSRSILGDLADGLLERFPELRTARAKSLGEAIDWLIPWVKTATIAAITAVAVVVIGGSAAALGVKLLLCLCVLALALYLISRFGAPAAVQRWMDEIRDRINRAFPSGQIVGQLDMQRGLSLVAARTTPRRYTA